MMRALVMLLCSVVPVWSRPGTSLLQTVEDSTWTLLPLNLMDAGPPAAPVEAPADDDDDPTQANTTVLVPGQGLEFEGTDFLYRSPVNGIGEPLKELTVAFWIKVNEPTSDGPIMHLASTRDMKQFLLTDPTNLKLTIRGNSSGPTGISVIELEDDGESLWNHIAITWTAEAGITVIYRNGAEAWMGDLAEGGQLFPRMSMVLGMVQGCFGGCVYGPKKKGFKGILYDFRVWKVRQTKDFIRGGMTSKLSGAEPDLLIYYRLDKGEGHRAPDRTINRNHGNFGTPEWFTANGTKTLKFTGDVYAASKPIRNWPGGSVTVSFWIKCFGESGQQGVPFSYAVPDDPTHFVLSTPASLTIYRGGFVVDTGVSVATAQWIHLSVSWQTMALTGPNLKVFKDGLIAYTAQLGVGSKMTQMGTIVLGQNQGCPGGCFVPRDGFKGMMHKFAIWGKARTATDLRADMSATVVEPSLDLFMYYPTLEGKGRLLNDKGMLNNHMDLSGPKWMLGCINSCSGHGRCGSKGRKRGKCICDEGFSAIDCSVGCPGNCSSHGTCVKGKCMCIPQYSGPDCSLYAPAGYANSTCSVPKKRTFCRNVDYSSPDFLNHTKQETVAYEAFMKLQPYCPTAIGRRALKHTVCATAFPRCVEADTFRGKQHIPLKPCRSMCREYTGLCGGTTEAQCLSSLYGEEPDCFNLAFPYQECPNNCSGHGDCTLTLSGRWRTCVCAKGFSGEDCSVGSYSCNSVPPEETNFCKDVQYRVPDFFNISDMDSKANRSYYALYDQCSSSSDGLRALKVVMCYNAFPRCAPESGVVQKPCYGMCLEMARRCGGWVEMCKSFLYETNPDKCFSYALPRIQDRDLLPATDLSGQYICPYNFSCLSEHASCIDGKCVCDQGFIGPKCTIPVPRCPKWCSSHGSCIRGKCMCYPGWWGPKGDCAKAQYDCSKLNDCNGNGKCQQFGDCKCQPEYMPPDCAKMRQRSCAGDIGSLKKVNCGDHGNCSKSGFCECDVGWKGAKCRDPDLCPNDCGGDHGECKLDPMGSPDHCECKQGWTGLDCNEPDNSAGDPKCPDEVDCGENGTCEDERCVCDLGWSGDDCSVNSDGGIG